MRHIPKPFWSLLLSSIALFGIFFAGIINLSSNTYADELTKNSTSDPELSSNEHFVTIYDRSDKRTVKTTATTVKEVLKRLNIRIDKSDTVEPALSSKITTSNFFVNIYRARPVIIQDGATKKYLLSSSYDIKTIADEAGLAIYDGDIVKLIKNSQFLETGVASVYQISRNGGRTVTVESSIPAPETTQKDPSMEHGKTKLLQVGEDGRKVAKYHVNFIKNREVSRELISEEITVQPTPRITVVGTKRPLPPEWETCANYARQAGVSEADLQPALSLIFRESGCRYWAENPSGAYGIPQALPGSKMASAGADWRDNPITQIRWMAGYVKKYNGWAGAWSFWQAHHWY